MWYVRGESKFSDHRPVLSLFSLQVNVAQTNKKAAASISSNATKPPIEAASKPTVLSSTCAAATVQDEELLLLTRAEKCIQNTPMFLVSAQKVTNQ